MGDEKKGASAPEGLASWVLGLERELPHRARIGLRLATCALRLARCFRTNARTSADSRTRRAGDFSPRRRQGRSRVELPLQRKNKR